MFTAYERVQTLLEMARSDKYTPAERHGALDQIHRIKRRGHYGFAKLGMDKYTLGSIRIAIPNN